MLYLDHLVELHEALKLSGNEHLSIDDLQIRHSESMAAMDCI